MRPLELGVYLEITEWVDDGQLTPAPRWNELRAFAQRAEALGFNALWISDHLIFQIGENDASRIGFWECWSLVAAVAAMTERIAIGTLVTCTAFRNPALLAKMADTVDEISGGRLILGLGAGYHEPEFAAFGYPFDHRGSRFEEALTIIHGLLRNGEIDFQGEYSQARDCELRPRGPRPHGPPILIAGGLPPGLRMLRLGAERADLWNDWLVFGRSHPDAVAPLRELVDAACVAASRDPASLRRTVTIQVDLSGEEPNDTAGEEQPLRGSPEELAEVFRSFAREGVDHLQLLLNPSTEASLDALAPTIALLERG